MAFGPLTIFDKSFLQGLSQYEAVWFDNFFRTIITPLFFVETLADLEKVAVKDKTPQEIVGTIAVKAPDINSVPNVHHYNLAVSNLLGYPVEMRRRPIISGGIPKEHENGYSLYFEEFPEAIAFDRWQHGKFLEVEKEFAKTWRRALNNPNFESAIAIAKNTVPIGTRFSDLEKIKKHVNNFIEKASPEQLYILFEFLDIPDELKPKVIARWEATGRKRLSEFAPYACFVFSVDLFFYISAGYGHIAKERTSNKVDMAYLYYLPFAHIMISNDKLHKRTVPLFMETDQSFVMGNEIKPELKKLDEYYDQIPEEMKEEGLIRFATYPPLDLETKISKLWDQYLPIWREHASESRIKNKQCNDGSSEIIENLDSIKTAPVYKGGEFPSDGAEGIMLTRRIRTRKGKWRTVPKEVEDAANSNKS